MKRQLRNYAWGIFLICGGLILVNFSSNPPDGTTGAPGDGVCSNCHSGGAQVGNIEVLGFPSEITPGATYDIVVNINKESGNATRAGFQLVVLDQPSSMGVSVGTFSDPGPSVNFTTGSPRQYMEHKAPELTYSASNCTNCTVSYTGKWTAPLGGVNTVHVFAAGNIADLGGTGGDRIVTTAITNIPLPIVLTKMFLTERDNTVEVNWETSSEENSDFYNILRSSNGKDYLVIGRVDAAGFSNEIKRYTFVDENPIINRTGYYKLEQFDIDGGKSLSRIESIEFMRYQKQGILVFPNPLKAGACIFVEYLSMKEMSGIQVEVFDQNGQRVYQDLPGGITEGMNKIIIDSKELPQGMYYVVISSREERLMIEKVIVL